ncbi:MAG: hypothetical protein ACR2LF_07175 [Jatrophihabitantaceae bacterium]
MTESPLSRDDVRALLDSLELLHHQLQAKDGLTATAATGYRVQGAIVAVRAVLGDRPLASVLARVTSEHETS